MRINDCSLALGKFAVRLVGTTSATALAMATAYAQIPVNTEAPQTVVVTPVPSNPKYAYTVVNNQRVIVDPETNTVVQVIEQ